MSESSNIMRKISSAEVAKQNREYVRQRKDGEITSMKTKFTKLNKCLMGGIELDTITCIAAMSGAGKSTLSKCFRDSFVDLNTDQKFKQYIFNFEMIAHQQIARSIVSEAKMSLKELYSVEEPMSQNTYDALERYYDNLAERDIDFIDVAANPRVICNSLLTYWKEECKPTNKTLVYELDHVKLVKGRDGQKERDIIEDLMVGLVDVKKKIQSAGGHSIGIVLSQMNRDIKGVDRVRNAEMHRPDASCLFGASAIEQCCDHILFSHIPAKLGIQSYTTAGLPVKYELGGEVYTLPYFELVKQRSGESDLTIPMWNKLKFFDFDEMESDIFKQLLADFETDDTQIPKVNLKQQNLF